MSRPDIKLHTTLPYYLKDARDIEPHESTASLAFRHRPGERNPFFRSRLSYGKTVAQRFIEKGDLRSGMTVLEIGGGEGQLADEFLDYARYRKIKVKQYLLFDLNWHLLQMQRRAVGSHAERVETCPVLADALSIPFKPESIDFLVANEVLADLPVIKNLSPVEIKAYPDLPPQKFNASKRQLLAQAAQLINGYGLTMPENGEMFHLNYGAIKLLFGIHEILRTGGVAFLTELSSEIVQTEYWRQIPGFLAPPHEPNGFPEELPLSGHSEFYVKFSHLETIARKIGFEIESGHLYDFVGLKDYSLLEIMGGVFQLDPILLLQFRYLILRKT